MIFSIFLILKVLLFMIIINVEINKGFTFFTSFLIIMFLFSIIHFSRYRKKNLIGLTIYGIISFIMFVDVMYFSYFNTLPSVKLLSLMNEVGAVGESIRELFTFKNALFLLDLPFLIIYVIKTKEREPKAYDKYVKWGAPTALGLCLLVFLSILGYKDLMATISSQELFTFHITDIRDALSEDEVVLGSSFITDDDIVKLQERSRLIEGEYTGIGQGKNLIVIQVEALQNFPINLLYEGQEVTPNLNRLIEDKGSLYFNNYYQQIGRGNTSDAEFVTNNSLYPSSEESIYKAYEGNTFYGLPWILRDNGYTSWVFHGYKKEFWNREKAYVNQGFQRFVSEEDYEFTEEEAVGFGIIDEVFYEQTLEYIRELDGIDENPFHAFIISLTSHTPFNMPEKFQYLHIKDEHKGTILGNYLQAIHYADMALGKFIEGLKEAGYYDNSVLAIYGDHFAITGLNDSGISLMKSFLGEPYDLDEMMKVPLIIHIPGLEDNRTITKLGSQLDFLPTILNIMGYENKKGLMFGRDLINYEGENFVAPITYVIKGSFIDDETIFYMSRDGIFKNSMALRKDTKDRIEDISYLRDTYEHIIDEINKSNYILKTDLIKHLLEGNGQVNLGNIDGENPMEADQILKCYDDPIKELTEGASLGKKVMSVLVKWARDKVVLSDGTDIEKLVQWMEENEDVYISLRSYEEDESIFMKIKEDYMDLIDRFIVEMTDFEQHINLTNKAYKRIMLNLLDKKYDKEEVLEFLNRTPLKGVIIGKDSINMKFVKAIEAMGIPVYVEIEDRLLYLDSGGENIVYNTNCIIKFKDTHLYA